MADKPTPREGWTISLNASIALAFTAAVVPILLFILSFSYRTNVRNLLAVSDAYAERAGRDTMAQVDALLAPVGATLRMGAALAAIDGRFYERERSREFLYKALISADQIDAVYASFEDGYHRVVTRVDADRRRSDPQIPPSANWHSSYIDRFGAGKKRLRHRTFFDVWTRVIKTYDVASDVDIRALPQYVGAKQTGKLFVSEPLVNPDTGGPVISLGYPILSGGRFTGFMGANITFDVIARVYAPANQFLGFRQPPTLRRQTVSIQ